MFSPDSEMPYVTAIESECKILASGVVIYLGGEMGKWRLVNCMEVYLYYTEITLSFILC